MKRTLIGIIVVTCLSGSPAPAQEKSVPGAPCGEHGTQAEANICARREYLQAEAEMSKAYSRVTTEFLGYSRRSQQKLRRAQASWLRYRNTNCESEASIYDGGSMRPAIYYSCLAALTRERLRRLEDLLESIR